MQNVTNDRNMVTIRVACKYFFSLPLYLVFQCIYLSHCAICYSYKYQLYAYHFITTFRNNIFLGTVFL